MFLGQFCVSDQTSVLSAFSMEAFLYCLCKGSKDNFLIERTSTRTTVHEALILGHNISDRILANSTDPPNPPSARFSIISRCFLFLPFPLGDFHEIFASVSLLMTFPWFSLPGNRRFFYPLLSIPTVKEPSKSKRFYSSITSSITFALLPQCDPTITTTTTIKFANDQREMLWNSETHPRSFFLSSFLKSLPL